MIGCAINHYFLIKTLKSLIISSCEYENAPKKMYNSEQRHVEYIIARTIDDPPVKCRSVESTLILIGVIGANRTSSKTGFITY